MAQKTQKFQYFKKRANDILSEINVQEVQITLLIVWHFEVSENPIMFSAEQIFTNGKSDVKAKLAAKAVLPLPFIPEMKENKHLANIAFVQKNSRDSQQAKSTFWKLAPGKKHGKNSTAKKFSFILQNLNITSQLIMESILRKNTSNWFELRK